MLRILKLNQEKIYLSFIKEILTWNLHWYRIVFLFDYERPEPCLKRLDQEPPFKKPWRIKLGFYYIHLKLIFTWTVALGTQVKQINSFSLWFRFENIVEKKVAERRQVRAISIHAVPRPIMLPFILEKSTALPISVNKNGKKMMSHILLKASPINFWFSSF